MNSQPILFKTRGTCTHGHRGRQRAQRVAQTEGPVRAQRCMTLCAEGDRRRGRPFRKGTGVYGTNLAKAMEAAKRPMRPSVATRAQHRDPAKAEGHQAVVDATHLILREEHAHLPLLLEIGATFGIAHLSNKEWSRNHVSAMQGCGARKEFRLDWRGHAAVHTRVTARLARPCSGAHKGSVSIGEAMQRCTQG